MTDLPAGQLGGGLIDRLRADPELDAAWLDTLSAVPRHLFLPDRVWQLHRGQLLPTDRSTDAAGWMEAAYSDDAIITQLDGHTPTSSCSMPYLVVRMLTLLDVQPGHRVLEIGTGTGWNAALLAHRLGDEQVVSVEVELETAAAANKALTEASLHPMVVGGDGAVGYPQRAPYDRIIATCAVHQVPYAWVEQTHRGGVMVVPWDSPLGLGGLLRLTVFAGGAASGPFVDTSSFMWLRDQQPRMPDEPDDFEQRAATSTATALPEVRGNLARFVVGLLVPDCQAYGYRDGDTIWLLAPDSWASVDPDTGQVRQLGPRRLWDEVESAYRWWVERGEPDLTRFGLTVTPERQWVWLDHPDQEVPAGSGDHRPNGHQRPSR